MRALLPLLGLLLMLLPTTARAGELPTQRDLIYCTPGGIPQKLDLYLPTSAQRPWPAVVYVHGGGWRAGDKVEVLGGPEPVALTARGYLVASVNYRLAPQYKFPAQIEDVKCAVRFLRANAGPLGLDPARIGAIGGSAGGHLAALLGLTDASAGFDQGDYPDQSSRVQAVVDLFAPTDLTYIASYTPITFGVFGADPAQVVPVMARASPITYVGPANPPFLIMHGDQDHTIPLSQSLALFDRLRSAGSLVSMVTVRNAAHGFVPTGDMAPSRAQVAQLIADFFDQTLKARA